MVQNDSTTIARRKRLRDYQRVCESEREKELKNVLVFDLQITAAINKKRSP